MPPLPEAPAPDAWPQRRARGAAQPRRSPQLDEAPGLRRSPARPKPERRMLRAALRWTAAVVVFGVRSAPASAYGITEETRTDVPGLGDRGRRPLGLPAADHAAAAGRRRAAVRRGQPRPDPLRRPARAAAARARGREGRPGGWRRRGPGCRRTVFLAEYAEDEPGGMKAGAHRRRPAAHRGPRLDHAGRHPHPDLPAPLRHGGRRATRSMTISSEADP